MLLATCSPWRARRRTRGCAATKLVWLCVCNGAVAFPSPSGQPLSCLTPQLKELVGELEASIKQKQSVVKKQADAEKARPLPSLYGPFPCPRDPSESH